MGGSSNFRPIWQQHTKDLNGIIFVIDSSDRVRFSTASEELKAIIEHKDIQETSIPILILANKNDIEGSAPIEIIETELHLNEIQNHPVLVKSICSFYPNDIFQSLEWLIARH